MNNTNDIIITIFAFSFKIRFSLCTIKELLKNKTPIIQELYLTFYESNKPDLSPKTLHRRQGV